MYYYPFHIGDFNNATRHLTRIERSVYKDLLDIYYDSESPLPNDLNWICKRALAFSDEEKEAVNLVLNEYFTLKGDSYWNDRCEQIIAEYREQESAQEVKRKNERERKRRYRDERSELFAKAKGLNLNPNYNQSNQELKDMIEGCPAGQDADVPSDGTAKKNHKPITNNQEPLTENQEEKPVKIPYDDLANSYNINFATPSGNSQIAKLNDKRKRLLKTAWYFDTNNPDENKRTNQLAYWDRYFSYLSEVPFLRDDFERKGEHKNWRPNLDYIVKEDTILKVKEGVLK